MISKVFFHYSQSFLSFRSRSKIRATLRNKQREPRCPNVAIPIALILGAPQQEQKAPALLLYFETVVQLFDAYYISF